MFCFLQAEVQAQVLPWFNYWSSGVREMAALTEDVPEKTRYGAFVKLNNGNVLYARHNKATEGMPTVVLMNGLPDGLDNWRSLEPSLIEKGYGVLAFDFRGQNNTLAINGTNFGDLHWKKQVEDVKALLEFFGLKKVVVAGLSYGGGIALGFAGTYPEKVLHTFTFAPFVEPVQPQDNQLQDMVKNHLEKNPGADREKVFEELFRYLVYTTYPLSEPSMLSHPLKPEAVTRMALGIRDMNVPHMVQRLAHQSLTIIGGSYDLAVPLDVLEKVWEKTPDNIRSTFFVVSTGHRITTWRPEMSATIIDRVLRADGIKPNTIYSVDERSKEFFHTQSAIRLTKIRCEQAL
ncbi:MAG: alpha/beta fold hydrolase [Bdellovibrio sp.]